MSKARNGKAVDVKKSAAADKPEPNGKSEKAKDVKIQTLTPANTKHGRRLSRHGWCCTPCQLQPNWDHYWRIWGRRLPTRL